MSKIYVASDLYPNNAIYHHGVKGMKWGVRKSIARANRDINFRKKLRDRAAAKGKNVTKANKDIAAREKIRDKKIEKATNKDFAKLQSLAKKSMNTYDKAYSSITNKNVVKGDRSNVISTSGKNRQIEKETYKVLKSGAKVDKMVSKLQNYYGTVDAVAKYDVKKGRAYAQVVLNNKKVRVYSDY